jgi:general secretion pathway protein G
MNAVKRSLHAGFGFLEIVITIAIVAIMLGVAVPNLMGRLNQSKIDSTKADVHAFKQSIDIFYADTGSYPNDLNELAERPTDERIGAKWSGPYMDKIKLDSWNHDFQYERTPGGAHPYELYSFGPKGEDAPEEERISAWE